MKKFELRENTREICCKDRYEIVEGCTLNQDDQEPVVINSFMDKNEAIKALKEYKTKIYQFNTASGLCYGITEYYIEENEYDEDGEWISGGDVWEFSKITILLVEQPSYDTLATFDNMKDAVKACNDYEGENEVYLSF